MKYESIGSATALIYAASNAANNTGLSMDEARLKAQHLLVRLKDAAPNGTEEFYSAALQIAASYWGTNSINDQAKAEQDAVGVGVRVADALRLTSLQ
jgi:hypothetical protein